MNNWCLSGRPFEVLELREQFEAKDRSDVPNSCADLLVDLLAVVSILGPDISCVLCFARTILVTNPEIEARFFFYARYTLSPVKGIWCMEPPPQIPVLSQFLELEAHIRTC